jgi:hypothetical protein
LTERYRERRERRSKEQHSSGANDVCFATTPTSSCSSYSSAGSSELNPQQQKVQKDFEEYQRYRQHRQQDDGDDDDEEEEKGLELLSCSFGTRPRAIRDSLLMNTSKITLDAARKELSQLFTDEWKLFLTNPKFKEIQKMHQMFLIIASKTNEALEDNQVKTVV